MKKLSLAITLLASFLSGAALTVGSVILWQKWLSCRGPAHNERAQLPLHFEPCLSGLIANEGGFPVSFTTYRSGNGIPVEVRVERTNSSELARKALGDRLQRAIAILQRDILKDAQGKDVGERVVAVFPDSWEAVVLTTDGPKIYSINSPSIRHALEFERTSNR